MIPGRHVATDEEGDSPESAFSMHVSMTCKTVLVNVHDCMCNCLNAT